MHHRSKILIGSILFITLYSGALFTFAIYQPSDQMLDPTCLPTDLGCYVAGGGGSPASPLNSIQYNDNGSFYGDSLFTRDAGTNETMISQVQGAQTATLGMGTTAFLGVAPFAGAMRSDVGGISAVGVINATAFSSSIYSAAMYSRDFVTNDSSLFLFQPNTINIHTDFNDSTYQSARIDLSSGANGGIDILMRDLSGDAYGFKTNLNNGFPETQIIYNSYDWNWPHADGNSGDLLMTDGSGNLGWTPAPTGGSGFTIDGGVGVGNMFAGTNAGDALVTGQNNFFAGINTGASTDSGYQNTFVGNQTGATNAGGTNNSFFGFLAGYQSTGSDNNFFGVAAGNANTSGSQNVFIGNNAGASSFSASFSTLVGLSSGVNSTGSYNTFLGHSSGGG